MLVNTQARRRIFLDLFTERDNPCIHGAEGKCADSEAA
jgi:hypothetical protein